MSLETYHQKRDFHQTAEPKGHYDPAVHGRDYLIQKHEARRLHYDFRLQIGGVLKSWAVPKGPSLDPKEKRLAVETEDHPLEYGEFEGVIPAKNYGAGTVMLWDRGDWECEDDPEKAYKAGKIKFELHGERLQGRWTLVRMKGRRSSGKEWLLVKDDDEYASADRDPTEEYDRSVVSERPMDAIAASAGSDGGAKPEKVEHKRSTRNGKKKSPQAVDEKLDRLQSAEPGLAERNLPAKPAKAQALDKLSKARKAPFPEALSPQLATLYKTVPTGDQWLHEIKYDGYRLLVHKQGEVKLLTRTGQDWTNKFSSVARALENLPESVIDGELVYLNSQGISSFEGLQQVLQSGRTENLVFYAFDMPYLEGRDLMRVPLAERKQLLATLISELKSDRVLFSGHIEGDGGEVFLHACQHGLEGIISKQADSTYQQARTKTWRKIKCVKRQEFVIVGFTAPRGSRHGFGALLVGFYEGDVLKYAGKVGTGFNHDQLTELHRTLKSLAQSQPTVSEKTGEKNATWVKPELVAEIEFTEWTAGNRLRHPAFIALRSDKPARQIVREMPAGEAAPSADDPAGKPGAGEGKAGKEPSRWPAGQVAGVSLSNADKVLYNKAGLTKQGLAEYYADIAEYILPHVTNRPLTLVRCPHGHARNCFFQKHLGDAFDESVKPIEIEEKSATRTYAYIDSLEGLIGLVQMGTLEIHTWGSRVDDVEKPDNFVFDLDPDDGIAWSEVKQAARDVRDFLDELGLRSFLRTSGGKGLHVVVPVQRRHDWDEAKAFCKAVAQHIAKASPDHYVATMSKAKRKNKIFIDYLRNGRGSTSICAYSTRSKPYAPVATPIGWDELDHLESSQAFHVDNVVARLRELTLDPWQAFYDVRQSVTQPIKQRLKLG